MAQSKTDSKSVKTSASRKNKSAGKSKLIILKKYSNWFVLAFLAVVIFALVLLLTSSKEGDANTYETTKAPISGCSDFSFLIKDGVCDEQSNVGRCSYDGGDCCLEEKSTPVCRNCTCILEVNHDNLIQLFKQHQVKLFTAPQAFNVTGRKLVKDVVSKDVCSVLCLDEDFIAIINAWSFDETSRDCSCFWIDELPCKDDSSLVEYQSDLGNFGFIKMENAELCTTTTTTMKTKTKTTTTTTTATTKTTTTTTTKATTTVTPLVEQGNNSTALENSSLSGHVLLFGTSSNTFKGSHRLWASGDSCQDSTINMDAYSPDPYDTLAKPIGSYVNSNTMVFCGTTGNCFKSVSGGALDEIGMMVVRDLAVSILDTSKQRLLVAGGKVPGGEALETSEFVGVDGFQEGPSLPYELFSSCFVKIDDGLGLLIGGLEDWSTPSQLSFFYDIEPPGFSQGPELEWTRHGASCGLLIQDNQLHVLVVGGSDRNHNFKKTEFWRPYLDSSGSFNPDQELFPKYPINVIGSQAISSPSRNKLFVFGGMIQIEPPTKNVFVLEEEGGAWVWNPLEDMAQCWTFFLAIQIPYEMLDSSCQVNNDDDSSLGLNYYQETEGASCVHLCYDGLPEVWCDSNFLSNY